MLVAHQLMFKLYVWMAAYAGAIQQRIQNQRLDCFRIPKPTRSVKKMLTSPDGMFIRAACLGL